MFTSIQLGPAAASFTLATFFATAAVADDYMSSIELAAVQRAIVSKIGLNQLHDVLDTRTKTGVDQVERTCGLASVSGPSGQVFEPVLFYFAKYPDGDTTTIVGAGGSAPAQVRGLCRKFELEPSIS